MTEPAFWDASALIPVCVEEQAAPDIDFLIQTHGIVIWWATPVEVRSSFSRLIRMQQLTSQRRAEAEIRLDELASLWLEIQPTSTLRMTAESLLARFPLRAAEALQLAAALTWAPLPKSEAFISGDRRLLEAAAQMGFHPIAV